MGKVHEEMGHWSEYDCLIVNVELGRGVGEVEAILKAERLRRSRQIGLPNYVRGLQATF